MADEVIRTILLYTAELSETAIGQVIQKARGAAVDSFAILERLKEVQFPRVDDSMQIASWERGRVFNEKLEVRWERNGESYRAWITLEADGITPDADWGEPGTYDWIVEERRVYLWGEDDPQIGRKMNYEAIRPAGGPNDRAQVVLAAYHDPDTYRLRHYRYLRMQRGE
jgi:hypothetical protein